MQPPTCFWQGRAFCRSLLANPLMISFAAFMPISILYIVRRFSVFAWGLLAVLAAGQAQPKLEFDMKIKKPKQFEERKLGSEKSADKKFTVVRRFFQNTYTHYNYYFNANEKLNTIISNATEAQKDDFTELLSFYPYSLDATSKSSDLDSIINTITSGILLHDLRNDWIDNLYLLLGKTYLHRQQFDSALMTFQFLNVSYAPKEKDGYDQPIASNSVEGSNALSVSTREKSGLARRMLSRPPSRNESFVWMIRTLTEQRNYIDASSLLTTLRNDPVFPARLRPELDEAAAYLYYCTQEYDSAAVNLERSMDIAKGMNEKARRYFLTGQLYQLAGKFKEASAAFEKSSKLAIDPVMDVYARLNMIRLRKSEEPDIIDKNIADLKSLARKDSYRNYRDIIYYAAALFEMERQGYAPAADYLVQSIRSNTNNQQQRSQSFFMLGQVYYAAKRYGEAALPYDSANLTLLKRPDSALVAKRRPGTKAVYQADVVIQVQDSLLRLALLDEPARSNAVRAVAKQLRKAKGLKEEVAAGNSGGGNQATTPGADMFGGAQGVFYFYDATRRASGFNAFREKWGDRPNTDNWRRSAAISINAGRARQTSGNAGASDAPASNALAELDSEKFDTTDISFDNLYSRLPISEERRLKANQRITNALFQKAVAVHEQIEDYPEAIRLFEDVLNRQDTGKLAEQTLFHLIHCYSKVGDAANATAARKKLAQLTGSAVPDKATKADSATVEAKATQAYQQVASLFLQGDFAKAEQLKRQTDSALGGGGYWTPQLLYIEAVYYLQAKQDSLAAMNLDTIITRFGDHPLAAKARLVKEVLPRRKEIEEYLTQLEVTRAEDDDKYMVTVNNATPTPKQQTLVQQPVATPTLANIPIRKPMDSLPKQLEVVAPTAKSPYEIKPASPQMVALVLENMDPAYVNEVQYSVSNSPLRNSPTVNGVTAEKKKLREKLWLLLLRSPMLTDATAAYNYIEYLKQTAPKSMLSWLDTSKYRFILISEDILAQLQQAPQLELYEEVLKQTFPGKF